MTTEVCSAELRLPQSGPKNMTSQLSEAGEASEAGEPGPGQISAHLRSLSGVPPLPESKLWFRTSEHDGNIRVRSQEPVCSATPHPHHVHLNFCPHLSLRLRSEPGIPTTSSSAAAGRPSFCRTPSCQKSSCRRCDSRELLCQPEGAWPLQRKQAGCWLRSALTGSSASLNISDHLSCR